MGAGDLWGFAGGVFALIVFETLTRNGAPERVGGLVDAANTVVKRVMDPSIPAIADHRDGATHAWNAIGTATANVAAAAGTAVAQAQAQTGDRDRIAQQLMTAATSYRKDPPL
jgi:hypothetical protein